jgi:hypothetical protein
VPHHTTIRPFFRSVFFGLSISAAIWISGCSGLKRDARTASLTLKDGSHFAGAVVRRDANSVTMVDRSGTVRTFLYSELADTFKYDPLSSEAKPSVPTRPGTTLTGPPLPPASAASLAPSYKAPEQVKIPVGTEFPVTTNGYLDSTYIPVGAFSVGTLEADIRVGGKVFLPQGSKVTIITADRQVADGRIVMRFDLGAANVDGHTYVISSEKGYSEPGLTVTFTGEKEGTPGAKAHGTSVHLDDHDLMIFKAVTPTLFKLPQ